jgi:hypothetical protein
VSLAGAAVTALTVVYAMGVYLPTLNTPHTSIEGVSPPPTAIPPTPGLSRRVSVVVVDGLSFDAARALDELMPLRRAGVMRSLAVEFPTYTSPALVSMITGLGPRDSGTRLNGEPGGVPGLDSVLLEALHAQVPVTLFGRGFSDIASILGTPRDTPFYRGQFAPGVDMIRRGVAGGAELVLDGKGPARALDYIHWGEVDEMGHKHGGASAQYREAARDAANFLVRYAASLDAAQDALVIVSDHGHRPAGGHGGDEPWVSHAFFLGVGGFFRQGVELGERPMRDVASTLSVLSGLRSPASNLGLPMLDALTLDDEQTSFVLAGPFDQASRFLCRLHPAPRCSELDALVARLQKPDPLAWEDAQALHAELSLARERDLDARRARGGPLRLAAAAVLMALAVLVGLRALARRGGRIADGLAFPALLVPLVNAGVYAGYLWSWGYRATFSHLAPGPIFARDAVPAGVVAVAATALFSWLNPPGPRAPWILLGTTAAAWALLSAFVGCDPVTPPPNAAGALVFLLGPAVISAAAGAAALAWMETKRRTGRGA